MKFDRKAHTIKRGKQQIVLPYKTWCVAAYLFDAAPKVVSRAELIDQIWDGNSYVGEKALNQALWAIRTSLKDDARAPIYIRTIPRQGYQWIGDKTPVIVNIRKRIAFFATLAATVLIVANAQIEIKATPTKHNSLTPTRVSSIIGHHVLANANKIEINYPQGCLLTLLSSTNQDFSTPVFSENGNELAFHVNHAGRCKLVVIDLKSKKYQKYDACPSKTLANKTAI